MELFLSDPVILSVSKKTWEGLNEEEKKIFEEAALESAKQQRAEIRRRDKEIIKGLESSLEVNEISDENREQFRKALEPFNERYAEKLGKNY